MKKNFWTKTAHWADCCFKILKKPTDAHRSELTYSWSPVRRFAPKGSSRRVKSFFVMTPNLGRLQLRCYAMESDKRELWFWEHGALRAVCSVVTRYSSIYAVQYVLQWNSGLSHAKRGERMSRLTFLIWPEDNVEQCKQDLRLRLAPEFMQVLTVQSDWLIFICGWISSAQWNVFSTFQQQWENSIRRGIPVKLSPRHTRFFK